MSTQKRNNVSVTNRESNTVANGSLRSLAARFAAHSPWSGWKRLPLVLALLLGTSLAQPGIARADSDSQTYIVTLHDGRSYSFTDLIKATEYAEQINANPNWRATLSFGGPTVDSAVPQISDSQQVSDSQQIPVIGQDQIDDSVDTSLSDQVQYQVDSSDGSQTQFSTEEAAQSYASQLNANASSGGTATVTKVTRPRASTAVKSTLPRVSSTLQLGKQTFAPMRAPSVAIHAPQLTSRPTILPVAPSVRPTAHTMPMIQPSVSRAPVYHAPVHATVPTSNYRPSTSNFHPVTTNYRPSTPAYRPATPAYRPSMPSYHPPMSYGRLR